QAGVSRSGRNESRLESRGSQSPDSSPGSSLGAASGEPRSGRAAPAVIAIGVGVLAALALAFWMWRGQSSYENARGAHDSDAASADAAFADDAREAARMQDLVSLFVDRGDWSDGRLASLNASLLEWGGGRIGANAQEAWFQRFVDELRQRLKEQQAL